MDRPQSYLTPARSKCNFCGRCFSTEQMRLVETALLIRFFKCCRECARLRAPVILGCEWSVLAELKRES